MLQIVVSRRRSSLVVVGRRRSSSVVRRPSAYDAGRRRSSSVVVYPGLMIGITGKVVSPEVYFAIALSGASQHMAGCSGSKNIVAINKDPEANIFKESKYGVVGDYQAVVPAFLDELKKLDA